MERGDEKDRGREVGNVCGCDLQAQEHSLRAHSGRAQQSIKGALGH